ncbi:MAG TPA: TlpA disulfide reductase family protein [Gemmatimonadales bacterium]|nr:TlpA disulfide reductase family protein [Gemmatimonadales bacterium]
MSRQWTAVLVIVGGLALGAAALVRYGPEAGRVEVGARAPDFNAVDLATGDSVAFRDRYRGHVTLVNIWATWCIPCRTEMPAMQGIYDSLAPRGFRIAAVSIDEGDATEVSNFAAELGLTFDILHDRSGRIQQRYQTTGVPESFLVDQEGVIVKRVIGAHDWSAPVNRQLIERLIEAAGS